MLINLLRYLVKSVGLKRRLTALISVVAELARTEPALNAVVELLQQIAGVTGTAGVAHAGPARTIKKYKAASIASVLAVLIALSQYYPVLLPFAPFMQKLMLIVGTLGLVKPSESN